MDRDEGVTCCLVYLRNKHHILYMSALPPHIKFIPSYETDCPAKQVADEWKGESEIDLMKNDRVRHYHIHVHAECLEAAIDYLRSETKAYNFKIACGGQETQVP